MVVESTIENVVCLEAKRRWGLESLKVTPRGDTGWPDRIFWVPGGRPLLVEFKRPGGKTSKRQDYIIEFLRSIEYNVQVHDNVKSALRACREALEAAQVPGARGQVRP